MSITADEISRILALLEKSSFDEIRIDEGELHIALSRNGAVLTEAAPTRPAPVAPPAAAASAPSSAATVSPEPAAVKPPTSAPTREEQSDAGLIEIRAPIVGIFYSAPEPGAEPFVSVGQVIDAETTVGIIEVMKVFNTVPAGVSGTVARLLVENGDFVEFGQPIFLVRPAGA